MMRFAEPEIDDVNIVIVVDQHIIEFEITMDHSLGVCVRDGSRNFMDDPRNWFARVNSLLHLNVAMRVEQLDLR